MWPALEVFDMCVFEALVESSWARQQRDFDRSRIRTLSLSSGRLGHHTLTQELAPWPIVSDAAEAVRNNDRACKAQMGSCQ
jgi:hypothetical protein